jgi:hypothetical protein
MFQFCWGWFSGFSCVLLSRYSSLGYKQHIVSRKASVGITELCLKHLNMIDLSELMSRCCGWTSQLAPVEIPAGIPMKHWDILGLFYGITMG